MIDRMVPGHALPGRAGAPLRALLFFLGFWILARILSECFLTNSFPVSGHATANSGIASLNSELPFESNRFSEPLLKQKNSRYNVQPSSNKLHLSREQGVYSLVVDAPVSAQALAPNTASYDLRSLPVSSAVESQNKKNRAIDPKIVRSITQPSTLRSKAILQKSNDRLSGYFWIFVRQNEDSVIGGNELRGADPFGSQYGGSQVGAHLTYRLIGTKNRNASIYGRASKALNSDENEEFAVGLKVNPVPDLPVSLHAEQRFMRGTKLNRGTAIFLTGGTAINGPQADLSFEVYGQAGYKFGRDESYFFDGSATVGRTVLTEGSSRIVLGGGAWVGGQSDAKRMDIGPAARIDIPIGRFVSRVSMDWRSRIAGDAAPGSGVTVSLTSGF